MFNWLLNKISTSRSTDNRFDKLNSVVLLFNRLRVVSNYAHWKLIQELNCKVEDAKTKLKNFFRLQFCLETFTNELQVVLREFREIEFTFFEWRNFLHKFMLRVERESISIVHHLPEFFSPNVKLDKFLLKLLSRRLLIKLWKLSLKVVDVNDWLKSMVWYLKGIFANDFNLLRLYSGSKSFVFSGLTRGRLLHLMAFASTFLPSLPKKNVLECVSLQSFLFFYLFDP